MNPKGKDAEKGGSQPMLEPAAPADMPQAEPMGEPAAETATDLLKEATGLLKSIRGLKAFRVKSVGEGLYGLPGEFALQDGGATHAFRQARPDEEADLIPTKVRLACGSTTLYKHPKHQTLLSKSPVEPIIPLAWLVAADYRITWRRDNIVIHHPTKGPLRCSLRGGCPVMSRAEGLSLLGDLEKMQQVDVKLKEEVVGRAMASSTPLSLEVHAGPRRVLEGGFFFYQFALESPKLWRSREVILHLFSGKNYNWPWCELEQAGYTVLAIDILNGIDLHDPAMWAFLWELTCAGKVVGVIGGPPCRTTSRLRQRQPWPHPLRGREVSALPWRDCLRGICIGSTQTCSRSGMP